MVISRTPHRISFFGGGSDFKAYFEEYGGSVLSTSIDKYCYVITREMPKFFPYSNQLTYSKIERFNNIDELEHPLVRETMRYLGKEGLQITYDADLPARSGLGTSSCFAVGLLNSIYTLYGINKDKKALAQEAIHIEREMCKEAGGIQDQIAVAYGGLNRINFSCDGFEVIPVDVEKARIHELEDNLMLFFTGFQRYSYEIAREHEKKIINNASSIGEMVKLVDEGERIIHSGSLDEFGRLLDYTWKLKASLTDKVSNNEIDELYEKAIFSGALGGKILGAGGGGFMLMYVPKEKQESVKKGLGGLLHIPFRFENSGTEIILKEGIIPAGIG